MAVVLGMCMMTCTNSIEPYTIEYGHEYFPINIGKSLTYQVDSTIYSSFIEGGVGMVSGQLREVYGNTFVDAEGRTATTVERYWRTDETVAWEDIIPTIWYTTMSVDSTSVERMEGQNRFIKMVFPISANKSWRGNSFIFLFDYDGFALPSCNSLEWLYTYTGVDQQATVGNFTFDETVSILQQDCDDDIDRTFSTELYAKNIGLVQKEQWVLNTGNSADPAPWPDRAERGYIVRMDLIDYD